VKITNIAEAKATLSKLVERVMQGEEVIIGKAGKPVAKLVPYERDARPRDLDQGIWQGTVWMADDFDELAAHMKAAFDGADEPPP
jgi:prevent-host-death family protein